MKERVCVYGCMYVCDEEYRHLHSLQNVNTTIKGGRDNSTDRTNLKDALSIACLWVVFYNHRAIIKLSTGQRLFCRAGSSGIRELNVDVALCVSGVILLSPGDEYPQYCPMVTALQTYIFHDISVLTIVLDLF